MRPYQYLTAVEQLAEHLRGKILRGEFSGEMPGVDKLAVSLGCSQKTVLGAVMQLEHEGILQKQGAGRRSLITPRKDLSPPSLRLKILLYQELDTTLDYMVSLRHQLQELEHSAGFGKKSLLELGMDVGRVARFVKQTEADAWIIFGGTREILEWFAAQSVPAFALFGRMKSVRIAGTGPDKLTAISVVTRRLVELGHHRVVFLAHEERRKPLPGRVEQKFLDEMQERGISLGAYNFPDWEDSPQGFHSCLKSLFQHTPPTALIIDTLELYAATVQFLCHHGISVPKDVSIICTDPLPSFTWSHPAISHISWDSAFAVRKILQWVEKAARGIDDRRQFWSTARFVEGGTIGPVPGKNDVS